MTFAKPRAREPLQPYQARRTRDGRWQPGATGNPMGRPESFAEYAYRLTGGGQELIDHAAQCLRGSVLVRWEDDEGNPCERLAPAQLKDQSEARAFLEEVMAPEHARAAKEGELDETWDFSALTNDELMTFERLLAKVRAPPTTGLLSPQRSEEDPTVDA